MELSGSRIWSKSNRFIGLLIIVIAAYLLVPRFLSYTNVINLVRQTFLLTLISYGMALSMLIGGLDLSLGSVAALSSVLAATFISQENVSLGILVGLSVGGACGLLNGLLIARFKLPDFIMTFSMMFIARGLAMTYTKGESIYGYPKSFLWIGKSFIGPVPAPVIISALLLVFLYFLLNRTTFGRNTYAVGVSKEAARFSGLSVPRKLAQVYTIGGLLAGLAGLIYIARLNSADAEMGFMWPLEAIAVCVIGGISFAGGEGNILGLVLGGIVMAIINNCLNLLGIPPRFQDFFVGFVIILAVTIDHYSKRREAAAG
jgi:ribose/xylose/arabinose/galactoside ABC-type transport system permease subunit